MVCGKPPLLETQDNVFMKCILLKERNGRMLRFKHFMAVCLIMSFSCSLFAADVILNEYSAVAGGQFLNGGNSSADNDGGRASDSYFGRVMGNGGDWFELVVITDHLDMRNWRFDIYDSGLLNETLALTNHNIWSDLRSGTIITVSEDVPSDINYNPAAGDWWINVQANNSADGLYISASNFVVSNNNWQLRIRNGSGAIIFGPAGEGVSPTSGISDTEIFRLETEPNASIAANSSKYSDGKSFSTFGSPNQWGQQGLNQLRTVVPASTTLTLTTPNGLEMITAGNTYTVKWTSTGTIDNVLIEYSTDFGNIWSPVTPPNVGNTGSHNWLVPLVNSTECFVRVVNNGNLAVYDISDGAFTIYHCAVEGDLTGDCMVSFDDFAVMADAWLDCGNPYNPDCSK
jgi:hypothetical protein